MSGQTSSAEMMKAVVIHGVDDVRVDTIACPTPGPKDVVVKVAACGICGSDLTYVKNGGVNPGDTLIPLGHEMAGFVSAIGNEVKGLHPGQKVIVNPYMNGIGNGGAEGAFADFLLVRNVAEAPENIIPLPDHLSMDQAALAEPLSVSLHGVIKAQPKPGQKVVIFGAGPIGLGMIVGFRRYNVDDIVVVDLEPSRLVRAKQLGARATINPKEQNVFDAIAELHGKQRHFSGMDVVGTDVFMDVAGAPSIIPDVINMCPMGARLVITAVYSKPVEVDVRMMLAKELSIQMAIAYSNEEFQEVVDMLSSGNVDLSQMISHHYDFSEFMQAFETARDAEKSAKVMVTFS